MRRVGIVSLGLAVCGLGCLMPRGVAVAKLFSRVESSQIRFVGTQMGVQMHGSFHHVSTRMMFDPDHPQRDRVRVAVTTASIDAGSASANNLLIGALWLQAHHHPIASFRSSQFVSVGHQHYQVMGIMQIRGITKKVKVPVIASKRHGQWILKGHIPLHRLDFHLGTGTWADTSVVGAVIPITIQIVVGD